MTFHRRLNCGCSRLASLLYDQAVKRDPGSRQDNGETKGGQNSAGVSICRVLALTILMVVAGAQAQEAEPEYDIYVPEQDAASALDQLAEQTGAMTLFPYDLVAGRTANAVIGRYTLPDALELLLDDTGLSGGLSEKRVISIAAVAAAERTDEEKPMGGRMRRRSGFFAGLAAALSGRAGSTSVEAQQAEDAGVPATGMLEEIIVTARRREESLMETPVSVTAFTSQELDSRQIDLSYQIGEATPNLVFRVGSTTGGTRAAAVYIRGVGQERPAPIAQPGVGIYVDGAYIGRSFAAIGDTIDIESIEVLRGPQGTLFGRNTVGGAILINSIKPSDEFQGDVEFTLGDFSRRELKGSVNVPFTDSFFGRSTVMKRDKDGYIDTPNVPGDDGRGSDDTTAARIALRWLTDSVTVDWITDYTDHSSDGVPFALGSRIFEFLPGSQAFFHNVIVAPVTGAPLFLNANSFLPLDSYATNSTFYVESEYKIWGSSLQVEWDLGDITLNSITTYREVDAFGGQDNDHSIAPVFASVDTNIYDQASQEFRLSGAALEDRLQWTAGVYYFEEKVLQFNDVLFPFFQARSGSTVDNTSSAVFGQFTYDVTDNLSITLGGRYTDEKLNDIVDDRVQYLQASFNPGVPGGYLRFLPPPDPGSAKIVPNQIFESDYDDFEPYFSVAYNWTDDLMGYFSYSEGFKGGGFTQRITPGNVVRVFEPEFAKVYELGAKWSGDRVGVTAAVFYNDYTNLQVRTNREIGGTVENASDAELSGGELELVAAVTDRFQVSLGLGNLDGEYKNVDPAVAFPATNLMPSVMDWQRNASAVYRAPVASGEIIARLDYSFTDDHFVEADNIPEASVENYSVFNAGLTFVHESEQWEISVQGRNITDELYWVEGGNSPTASGYVQKLLMPPAEWSASCRYRF